MRRGVGLGGALAAGLAIALVPAGEATSHPLGNFTVNQYDGVVVSPGQLRVDHVEDLAEIPATQVMPRIKRVGMRSWAEERCEDAARGSRLRVDGRAAELRVEGSRAVTLDGQAGLPTLRVECELGTPGHRAHRPLRCGRRTSRSRVAGSHRPGGSDAREGI